MDSTGWIFYLAFKIEDQAVLETMQRVFENIKKGIWSDEAKYPEVHRVKFNWNFKHIRLCSASIGYQEVRRLVDAFEDFTRDHAEELQAMRARFSELECEQLDGKIRVSLVLCPDSLKIIRDLQSKVIAHFEEFQSTETTWMFDLRCRLLSLNTAIPFEEVKKVVSACSNEVQNLGALLGPFILEIQRRILCRYPPPMPAVSDFADDDAPEWLPRSVSVFGFSKGEASVIFHSIADWFEVDASAAERCFREADYYEKPRILVVFQHTSRRDEFYAKFMRRLAMFGGRVFSNQILGDGHQGGAKLGVYKAMPREKDRLFFRAEEICWRELRAIYRPRVDDNLDLYLHQFTAPHQQHYFDTQDELDELVETLKRGNTTEYLTFVC